MTLVVLRSSFKTLNHILLKYDRLSASRKSYCSRSTIHYLRYLVAIYGRSATMSKFSLHGVQSVPDIKSFQKSTRAR